ncbi:MAG: hypothetical protein M1834_009138 [Cirrosporium novae-zelandiae]|nr:MAG: hypothetical protein M1834_009138 [Cirrosporium novae-zelandiae]
MGGKDMTVGEPYALSILETNVFEMVIKKLIAGLHDPELQILYLTSCPRPQSLAETYRRLEDVRGHQKLLKEIEERARRDRELEVYKSIAMECCSPEYLEAALARIGNTLFGLY